MRASDYIARMDADDVAMPERLARQTEFMDTSPGIGLCGCQVRLAGKPGPGLHRYAHWLNRLLTPQDLERDLFIECPVAHPAFCMRRESFEAAGGYRDRGWPEDYCLLMRIRNAGFGLANVGAPLLEWTHRAERLSMNDPRYEEAAFRALKRHYLFEGPLFMPPQEAPRKNPGAGPSREGRMESPSLAGFPDFHQWGAGEVGKRWLREWGNRAPAAVVDINPRKIGRTIHGVPVVPPEDLPPPGNGYTLVAVGAPGARAEIRDWFTRHGYLELRDYRFLA